jgi:hypothetical protein
MATQASAFPRLSPSGRRVVAGEKVIVIDQSIDVGPGTSGQWGDDDQIFYTRQPDGAFMEWHSGAPASVIHAGFNAFSVGGKNRWAGYSAARGVVQFDNGTVVVGWSGPALSDDPSVWAAVIHATGEIVTSHGRPQRFADRDCRDLRWCGRALVWNVYVLGRWQIAGCREPGAIVDLLNVEPEEFAPVPLLVNGELWLMTHSHNRLLLRPWGLRTGYVVATGITNTPDAKQLPDGLVRVVWDAGRNVLGDVSRDPSAPMVSLERPAPPAPVEDTSGQPVDLWAFFLPQPGAFPRTSSEAGHGHEMHCLFDGRNFWTLPFGEPDHWVRMVVEGDTLTFREDRSRDNQNTGDYSFTHGLWARRQMRVGDRILKAQNNLVRYQPDGCRVVDVHAFPFRTGLWKHWTSFDCGGDLGWQDVIAYLYDPGGLQDTYELSYYAKGYGLFRWEEYDQKTNALRHWTTFNEFGGRAPHPTPGCWKPEHLALTPMNQQVSMTIIEPTAYPTTAAGNRLRVVCGPEPGSHWSEWVEWIYRRVGESTWTQQGERRNPRDDQDHTFTFPAAGEYEIGLRWSSGQTGRSRVVRVEGTVVQPPPPPPPEQSTMQIQTNDRQHYITVSESGLGTATQTSADHKAVQLTLVRGDDGRFALRGPNGKVGSAQPDGTFTFDREKGDDWRPDGWEALRAERSPLGGESYVTDHGTRLRAVNQGGSGLRHDARDVPDIDETFWPSQSLTNGGHVGGGPVGPSVITGRLRKEGRALADDAGYSLPVFCHSGTGVADLLYDEGTERQNARLIKSVGYAGRRVWTRLRGTAPWSTNPQGWGGREFGHETMGHDAYRNLLITSFLQHQELGLKLVLSAGDIEGIDNEHEIRTYVRLLGDALETVSPDGSLCSIFESGNELPGIWRNGSPERSRDWILKPFKARFPGVLCTNSQGANESREERFRWCLDPADLDDIHSFRDNHWYDWIRHVINNAYVHEHGTHPRDIIWGSEPFGTGRLVSVQPRVHEFDEHVAQISVIAHLMTGQIPCYFCSPGIRFDVARDLYGETYEAMPGFATCASVAKLLPADIMTWPRENIVHGGREDPPGSPNPIFQEPGSGDIDRAYHVFSADHRRFAALIFGGESLDSRPYRAYSADIDVTFGNKARLVVGRAA